MGTLHCNAPSPANVLPAEALGVTPQRVDVVLLRGRMALLETAGWWGRLDAAAHNLVGPFQRRAWALAWLATFGANCEPWILVAGNPVISLLPLALVRRHGLRVIRFVGHGVSDYLGAIPLDTPAEAYRAFGAALSQQLDHYDLIDLQSLSASEDRRQALVEGVGRRSIERMYEACPVIDTAGHWAGFLASRRKRFRANLKRAHRRLCIHGEVAVRREPSSASLLREMASVERESWKWTKGFSFLRDDRARAFLETVLLGEAVPHELWTIRLSGELAGFAVVFIAGKIRYYYLPSFRERYSDAGTLLMAHIVRDSFDGDWHELDLLRGDESYKLSWAHETRNVYELVFVGRTLHGHAALAGTRLRWRLSASRSVRRLHATLLRLRRRSRIG